MRKLVISLLVFGLAGTTNALNLSFSTDGSTTLPDGATIDVAPGSTSTVWMLSSGPQGAYWTYLEMDLPQEGSIPFEGVRGSGGEGVCWDTVDFSTPTLMDYYLAAYDDECGIVTWSFDLIISSSTATDGSDDFDFWATVPNDSSYGVHRTVNVHIPEPGSIALIGVGSILLLRRRKREKA